MIRNNIQQTTNTAGGGTYNLTGTVASKGVLPFASACVSGKKYRYKVETQTGTVFEVNEGTFTSGGPSTITRDRLIQSSTGSPIAWPDPSDKIISLVAIAEDFGPEGGRHAYLLAGGTATAYTGSSDIPTPVLVPGMRVRVKIPVTNSGACTYNHNSLGAKSIKKRGVTLDPEAGELPQDMIVELVYEAADVWQVVNPAVMGSLGVKVVSGATYTVLAADVGKLLVFTNAAGCAVTLPQATGAFLSPWWTEIQNAGAGSVVVTPTTSTIDGAATLTILPNSGAEIRSDSTNYRARRDYSAPSQKVPVRQTTLASSVDANGLPNFISIGSGLAVNVDGNPVPLILTAANGFDSGGAVDRIGVQAADTSITGLTANSTNYLYADIDAAGVITFGKTTIAPVYQLGGTYSVTNGQFTFNIAEKVGKVGNGSSASQVWRVFIGEAVTNASNVTSVVNYAIQGAYVSAWTATLPGTSTRIQATHNIGTNELYGFRNVEIECTTIDQAYAVGDRQIYEYGSGGATAATIQITTTRNGIEFTTSTGAAFYNTNKTAGTQATLTAASWKYRVFCSRGW